MSKNYPLRISFLAPTSYGKTTAVHMLNAHYKICHIKLASPLIEMQNMIYSRLNTELTGQDGELLQFLGAKIQRDYPDFLAVEFHKQLQASLSNSPELILNDDCRPHNYKYLKEYKFIFVKIESEPHERLDTCPIDPCHQVEWNDSIPYDYCIANYGSIPEYEEKLIDLVEHIRDEYIHL